MPRAWATAASCATTPRAAPTRGRLAGVGLDPGLRNNVVLVEWVWTSRLLVCERRALDQDPFFPGIDVPMLKAL